MLSRRSPHGERGLKYIYTSLSSIQRASLPTRGAWIEISGSWTNRLSSVSLPTRGAWIEIAALSASSAAQSSLPTRGAWIEMDGQAQLIPYKEVAPHTGSVD